MTYDLNQIMTVCRISPYFWYMLNCVGGLSVIFYNEQTFLVNTFAVYNVINIFLNYFFDSYVTNFTQTVYWNPNCYEKLCVINKKRSIEEKNYSSNQEILNDNEFKIDLNVYLEDDNITIKYILFCIYFLGLTTKNFTTEKATLFSKSITDIINGDYLYHQV